LAGFQQPSAAQKQRGNPAGRTFEHHVRQHGALLAGPPPDYMQDAKGNAD
jgi:hypothetical protein